MSDKSKIEWCDATWNPTRGCTQIAPGCAHCYALTFAERWRGVTGHPYEQGFDPRLAPGKLAEPLKWKAPRRIFVNSMSDLFHEAFPFDYIAAVFGVMSACQQHSFLVLTKRPGRAVAFFAWIERQRPALTASLVKRGGAWPDGEQSAESALCAYHARHVLEPLDRAPFAGWPLPNVWIGTSIANQVDADKNIPHLLQIPAAVRFVSAEPLIGSVNLKPWLYSMRRGIAHGMYGGQSDRPEHIDWVIVGGESGPGARPCDAEWIRSLVAQSRAAEVPVFVKQLGAVSLIDPRDDRTLSGYRKRALSDRKGGDISEWPEDLRIREFPRAYDSEIAQHDAREINKG